MYSYYIISLIGQRIRINRTNGIGNATSNPHRIQIVLIKYAPHIIDIRWNSANGHRIFCCIACTSQDQLAIASGYYFAVILTYGTFTCLSDWCSVYTSRRNVITYKRQPQHNLIELAAVNRGSCLNILLQSNYIHSFIECYYAYGREY